MQKLTFIGALLGSIGWVMLVIPDLHFLYKEVMPILGSGKYIAFLIMGIAMFVFLPIFLVQKGFAQLWPSQSSSLIEKAVMGLASILSVILSRAFM